MILVEQKKVLYSECCCCRNRGGFYFALSVAAGQARIDGNAASEKDRASKESLRTGALQG
ncbi:MAG TPA: hypothetical protein GXX19_01255 [Syntrophomonadaceae bacterium]|nr:hypothetical protein [Syntrophomonadaceae bacterium]